MVYVCGDPNMRVIAHLLEPKLARISQNKFEGSRDKDYLVASNPNFHCFSNTTGSSSNDCNKFLEHLLYYTVYTKIDGCTTTYGGTACVDIFGEKLWHSTGRSKATSEATSEGTSKGTSMGRQFKGVELPQLERKWVALGSRASDASYDGIPAAAEGSKRDTILIVKDVPPPTEPPEAITPLIKGLTAAAMLQGVKLEYGSPPESIEPTLVQRSKALEELRVLRGNPIPHLNLEKLDTLIAGGEAGVVERAKEVVEAVVGGGQHAQPEVKRAIDELRSDWATKYTLPPDLGAKLTAAEANLHSLPVRALSFFARCARPVSAATALTTHCARRRWRQHPHLLLVASRHASRDANPKGMRQLHLRLARPRRVLLSLRVVA